MLTLVFMVLMFVVFGKLMLLAVKATWGISKVIVSFVLFPLVLIGLLIAGLVYIAVPVLMIAGIAALFIRPRV